MDNSPLRYIPGPALLVGADKLEIIEGNSSAAEITGVRTNDLPGMEASLFFPSTQIGPMNFERALFRNNSGIQYNVELSIQAYNEGIQPSYILTFRKRDEQFQELMDGAVDGIVILDKKLNVLEVNPALCSITERNREDLVGNNAFHIARKFVSAQALNTLIPALKQMASGKSVNRFEIEYRNKTLALSTKIQKNAKSYIGIISDISKEKETQKAIQESEEKFRFFAESSFEGIVLHNRGIVLDANESFLKMTGYTLDEAIGKNLFDYVPGKKDRAKLLASMLKRKSLLRNIGTMKKDGSFFTIEIESKDVKYNNKKVRFAAIRDVTEQIALQNQLKESEERYRTIFEKSATANVIIEKNQDISLVNTKFADLVGYPIEAIENKKKWIEFTAAEDIEKMDRWHKQRRSDQNQPPREYEFRLVDRLQNIKNIKVFVDLIPGTEQSIASLIDISDSKETLEKLKNSESRLKKAQSIAKMGDWSLNLSTGQASGSEETKRIYGIKGESMSGELINEIHMPEYREKLNEKLQNLTTGKSEFDNEFKIKNQETGQILDVRSIAEFNPEENIVTGVIQDITRMKEAESSILQREQYLNSIFRAAPVGIGVVAERHIKAVNEKLCEITGYSEDELLNKSSRIFYISDEEYERVGIVKYREIGEHGTGTVETKWKCKDGSIRDILLSSTSIDIEDLLRGVTFTALDITKRKKTEQDLLNKNRELIQARDKAEESDRLKTAFLANMSHEIRTPMNGILGFTNLLENQSLSTETMQSYLEIINKCGDRLLGTVNDLIDISKLEAGLENILIEDTGINILLDNLYKFFQREAETKGVSLNYHKALSEHPLTIRTDEKKLNSILTNLIKNAIKYTHQGSVEFGYREITGKGNSMLEFHIRDTGIGIPISRQEAIFNRFEQADIEDHNVYEGSGLGLTIAKSLVDMLGGKIWLESSEGEGSTFFFTIPLIRSEGKAPVSIETNSVKQHNDLSQKLKILIAEDDVASFLHLSILTKNISRRVLHVTSGTDAVNACREHPDIDLVLMDIKMPGMDGLEATRRIREFNTSIPIIAQTAYALAGDREKAVQAGCNDHITKPILREDFMAKLALHTGSQQ